jgi:hypothetical protein
MPNWKCEETNLLLQIANETRFWLDCYNKKINKKIIAIAS